VIPGVNVQNYLEDLTVDLTPVSYVQAFLQFKQGNLSLHCFISI